MVQVLATFTYTGLPLQVAGATGAFVTVGGVRTGWHVNVEFHVPDPVHFIPDSLGQ